MDPIPGVPALVVFLLLLTVWFSAEAAAARRARRERREGPVAGGKDRGSFGALVVASWVALAGAVGCYAAGLGPSFPAGVVYVGIALVAAGVLVRCWAILALGRFFSVVIRIESEHEIVRVGPYRWLRHPSYTGVLLASLGSVLALGTVSGLLLALVALLVALGYRIHVEEAMLLDRFGDAYREYARSTWRVIPGVF